MPLPLLLLLMLLEEEEALLGLRLAVLLLLGSAVPVQRPPGARDEVDALLSGVAVACW